MSKAQNTKAVFDVTSKTGATMHVEASCIEEARMIARKAGLNVRTKEIIREIKRVPYRGHWIEIYHYRDYDGEWLSDCAIDGEFSQCEGIANRRNLTIAEAKQIIDETIKEDAQ